MLAVSRSFGNFNLKNIISCEPIVSMYNIQPDDLAIVMATDGLWNVSYKNKLQLGIII